jgi:hypothetical protein
MTSYDLPRIKHDGLREIHHGAYTLVRYKKPLLDPSLGKYRSVVYQGDRLVAFSPPRSTPQASFEADCATPKNAVVREFVDGMMIYVWFDSGRWRTSTRSCVEGEKIFRRGATPVPKLHEPVSDSAPTPHELFLRFVAQMPVPLFDLLDKTSTYVFTLMDPDAFNVVKSSALVCYLTNVYKILEGNRAQSVHIDAVLPQLQFVNVPTVHYFRQYSDITDYFVGRDYSFKGFMVHDPKTDQRAKILNPSFMKVHERLSAKPNFNEIVLEAMIVHKDQNEIAALHADYPKHIEALERNILRCSNVLFGYYLECFVKKQKAHKDFPVLYRTHMYELHKMYLTSFRQLGFRMNKSVVLDYVKSLPLAVLVPLVGIH